MGRADGTRIKNDDPMYFLIPRILRERHDAMNAITEDIPLEPLRKYMNAKRTEGQNISHLALLMCAYMKACGKFPKLNRFVVNKKIYERNEVCASMVVLRPGTDGDTMSKIYFDPEKDTIFDVQKKIDDYIESCRDVSQENSLDKLMSFLLKSDFITALGTNLLVWGDRHGLLPKSIIDASPFHATFLVSNLASIRTNHIYHHVYDFGTTSVAIVMGNMREIPKTKKGEIVLEKCIPLGIVMDERICSGHYFSQVFAYITKLLSDPTKMEVPGYED